MNTQNGNRTVLIFLGIMFIALIFTFSIGQIRPVYVANEELNINITEPRESNGGIPVNIQDQTSRAFDFFFVQDNGAPTTLTAKASINDTTISVANTTTFSVGDYIALFAPGFQTFYFGEVMNVGVNTLDLDTPIDSNFAINSLVISTTRELNVDGSVTSEVFAVRGPGAASNFSVDITRIMIEMTCVDVPDFDDFCDISGGLTNGIVLRRIDGVTHNYWNSKSNAELANLMYDVTVLEQNKVFNTNGVIGRFTFSGQDKHGVAVRLDPGDRLELLIQDDLSSLLSFRIIAAGHMVTD